MKYLVQYADISNQQAFYIATLGTAESIGVDAITGSIERGKSSDLIVLGANPLEDLSTMATPRMVISQGAIAFP